MAGRMTWQRRLLRCSSVTVVLLAWEITARSHVYSAFLLPSVSGILVRLLHELGGSDLPAAIGYTISRALAGFVLAAAVGIPLGVLIARVSIVRWFFDPLFSVGLPTPKIAFLPIFILWFGVFDAPKILMAAFNAVFPIIVATWAGAQSIDKFLLWSAASTGARRHEILWDVVLPAAMPSILTGLQIGIPFALIVTVVSEMATGGDGLGGYMIVAMRLADSPGVFVGLLCTGFVGFVMLKLMEYARRRLLVWHEENHR
jgi:ABC-type nitrate/sulfonate/bicarbonate transport system permease component